MVSYISILSLPCTVPWGVHGSLVVGVLDCQSRGSGFKSRPGQIFGSRFLFHLHPLANSAIMSTLTVHCQWEEEMVRERTGHLPSCAKAKKVKLLTRHTNGSPRASLRDCSSLLHYHVISCNIGVYYLSLDINTYTSNMYINKIVNKYPFHFAFLTTVIVTD